MSDGQPCWGSNGRKIPYPELSDDHLKNIIKDGYRNPHLIEECKRRGFEVPVRPVDTLTRGELAMWLESFSSCAISGNDFSKKMMDRWNNDKVLFYLCLNSILVKENGKNLPNKT